MMSDYEKTGVRMLELTAAGLHLHEKRLACLWDMAHQLAAEPEFAAQFTENDGFRRRYREMTARASVRPGQDAVFAFTSGQLSALERAVGILERAYLCRILAKLSGWEDCRTFGALSHRLFREAPEESPDRVAYLENLYADEAYRRFSGMLHDPTVLYADSFSGVCETVSAARARMCILPMENSTDGILTGFRALLAKYDLKIVAVCEVPTGDESMTRFALLQKSIGFPGADREPVFFRFTLFSDSPEVLGDVMLAADALGLPLCKIDTVSAAYTDFAFAYDVTLTCRPETLAGFYCYLSMEIPHFVPVGLFGQV